MNTKRTKIIYKNDYPFFEFDEKIYSPCMFRSFRPTPANVSLAHRAGIEVFQIQVAGQLNGMDVPYSLYGGVWQDKGVYNFKNFDRQIEMFKKFAHGAKFIIFIQLDAPEAWLEKHKNSLSSFYFLHTSAYDEEWKNDASEYLCTFLEYCENTYGDDILGYGISAGRSTEWFSGTNYYNENTKKAYENYIGKKCDKIPEIPEEVKNGEIFRSPESDEYKFLKFAAQGANITAEFFAKEAQKVINHKKPLGLFGGYYNLKDSLLNVNDFARVWDSGNIDMILAPASYDDFRQIENSACVTVATDSLKMRGIVHINELDHRTELAQYPMEHPVTQNRMGYRMAEGNIIDDCYDNSFDASMVLRREFASSVVRKSMLWWFDFFGGYYASPEYEKLLSDCVKIYNGLKVGEFSHSVAEVAVFADAESNYFIKDKADVIRSFCYNGMKEFVKCAVPYDLYNLCDIEKIDLQKYKLCIFLNSFKISKSQAEKIKNSPCKKMWIYAPGCVENDKINFDNIGKITGMNIKTVHKASDCAIDFDGCEIKFEKAVNPYFIVDDDGAERLADYKNTNGCAFAYKNGNFYIGSGNVPEKVWRFIAKKSGVHIYCDVSGAFFADERFISYQTVHTENIEIHLKEDAEFCDLFDGGIYKSENKILKYTAPKGTSKLFEKISRKGKYNEKNL